MGGSLAAVKRRGASRWWRWAASSSPSRSRWEGSAVWLFLASIYFFQVPDDTNYAQPAFTADRDSVHLEARYNYEDLDTGSLWIGYNLGGGGKVTWELTPMLGGVFGRTAGIAPGYRGAV